MNSYLDGYYDEDYYEPSKIEQAYLEFLEKTKECVKEDFAQLIKQTKENSNYNYNEAKRLVIKENELDQREREIDEKYNNLEKHKDNLIAEWLSQYGLDLKIGQKVYIAKENIEWEECTKCKGTGKIKVKSEDTTEYEIDCPDCKKYCNKGKKKKIYYTVQPMYVVNVSVDLKLMKGASWKDSLKIIGSGRYCFEFTYYSIELNEKENLDYNNRYYNRKNIYITEEECLKAIDVLEEKDD